MTVFEDDSFVFSITSVDQPLKCLFLIDYTAMIGLVACICHVRFAGESII